ncbi:photosystem reaction center subunit H, partial [Christiangramia aquimixticola]|uniref:photosystem reaction center subunit H n=1 Tax=Christiangramia aquimixticola TaxID=1697558 RepID=UPI003AA8B6E6
MATQEKHLYYLSELKDYKVDHHDHDIRGWTVKDRDYRTVGKVDNLLVNKELQKVVYVDVEVDQSILDRNYDPYSAKADKDLKEFINKDGENHIIIPIGLVEINDKEKYIYTASIDHQTFSETKRYRSGTEISRNYEHHVLGSYNRGFEDDVEPHKNKPRETDEYTRNDQVQS